MEKMALNVTEVSEVLGVSRPVVYQLLKRADFPSFKIGKRTLVSREALQKWVENETVRRQESMENDIRFGI